MKKILSCMLYGVIVLFGVIFLLYIYFFVMDKKDRKSLIIYNFSQDYSLTITPVESYYVGQVTHITGFVNDTIIVDVSPNKPARLCGEIDFKYFFNFLGQRSSTVYIKSYKATQGRLKVRHGFY